MLYDLNNDLYREKFKLRCESLLKSRDIADLKKKAEPRTSRQNRYLHVILAYFGCETGNTMEYVKQKYFKKLVNPDIFIRTKQDKYLGETTIYRSSKELNKEEMSTAIDRFRNWASMEAQIYLPGEEDLTILKLMEVEIDRNKDFI